MIKVNRCCLVYNNGRRFSSRKCRSVILSVLLAISYGMFALAALASIIFCILSLPLPDLISMLLTLPVFLVFFVFVDRGLRFLVPGCTIILGRRRAMFALGYTVKKFKYTSLSYCYSQGFYPYITIHLDDFELMLNDSFLPTSDMPLLAAQLAEFTKKNS
jgi:hypothetical protein